tara:strand:+ start:769 stop:1848 length:1080 start_codon:yes stop_codon:yes gene_type:complete
MTLTYSRYATFDEVVTHYNNTTPLRGKDNAGKDIRPIGDRKRKYERIVKISANCYALTCGWTFGDAVFPAYHYGDEVPAANKTLEKFAPIVWRRLRDGTDQVTLRNGWGPDAHTSHYAFLYRHTPAGIHFTTRSGRQYLTVGATQGIRGNLIGPLAIHYLAKVRTTPKPVYRSYRPYATKLSHSARWMQNMAKFVMLHDDNSAVVFRRKNNSEWQHVEGTGRQEPQNPRVDKEAKAAFKDDINKFFEWGMAMSPLLPLADDDYRMVRSAELHTYFGKKTLWRAETLDNNKARTLVRDDENSMRLAFWVRFASSCTNNLWGMRMEYYTQTVGTKEDLAYVRASFNTFINKQLGFVIGGKK